MQPLEIEKIELFMMGDENALRLRHTGSMGEIYAGTAICRITTSDGYSGAGGGLTWTENFFDSAVIDTVKLFAPGLLHKSALKRGELNKWMMERPSSVGSPAVSIVDIALWDLMGQYARLPVYELMGACRDRILSYASTPLMNSPREYVEFIEKVKAAGFKAVKIHCPDVYEEDIKIVEAVQEHFGSSLNFMIDLEGLYSRHEALRMCQTLEKYNWRWVEAPLNERDFSGFRYLHEHCSVPIIGSGLKVVELQDINNGLQAGAWSALRSDTAFCGGLTQMQKICALAEANNMSCEIQSWAPTLAQAAALQMMLACNNCSYFEQALPYEQFETAAKTVIRTQSDGYVYAPDGNNGYGLGIEMDWDKVEQMSVKKYCIE